jgi:hypothetical protein
MLELFLVQASAVATDPLTWPEVFSQVGCSFALAWCVWTFFRHAK